MGGVLVSDNGQETEVQGDVTGSVQSGAFHGPVQTVNVHIPPVPPPPDTAGPMERIRFLTAAMMQLQSYFVSDRNDREARQEEADVRYEEAKDDRTKTRRMVLVNFLISLVSLVISILSAIVIIQLVLRLEWVWQ